MGDLPVSVFYLSENIRKLNEQFNLSVDRLYRCMKESEDFGKSFSPCAPFVLYRLPLVDWIYETGSRLRFTSPTMERAVQYMDRTLQSRPVSREKYHLVAIACLLIAWKCEEPEEKCPTLPHYCRTLGRPEYTTLIVSNMETLILNSLNWELLTYTCSHFLNLFLSVGTVYPDDRLDGKSLSLQVIEIYESFIRFFADFCMQHYCFQSYRSSLLAAAIIVASRCALHFDYTWRSELELLTGFSESDCLPVFAEIWSEYKKLYPAHLSSPDTIQYNSSSSSGKGALPATITVPEGRCARIR